MKIVEHFIIHTAKHTHFIIYIYIYKFTLSRFYVLVYLPTVLTMSFRYNASMQVWLAYWVRVLTR